MAAGNSLRRLAMTLSGLDVSGSMPSYYNFLRMPRQPPQVAGTRIQPGPSSAPALSAPAVEQARAVARERGGRLISGNVPNGHTPVLWKCGAGHRWTAQLSKVKAGTWCPRCAGNGPVTIEDMRRIAGARGGRCLSPEYVNNRIPLRWRCSQFHEWLATPGNIRRTWCPVCAGTAKLNLRELRTVAREHGGVLLSKRYVNSQEPLSWRCGAGHVWKAAAAHIQPGRTGAGRRDHVPNHH